MSADHNKERELSMYWWIEQSADLKRIEILAAEIGAALPNQLTPPRAHERLETAAIHLPIPALAFSGGVALILKTRCLKLKKHCPTTRLN
jgi:hypothetical protein